MRVDGWPNSRREMGRICRQVARALTEGEAAPERIDPASLSRYLGAPKFFSDAAERTNEPGVATGMAWTPNGGDILFIESTRMSGQKGLRLTGSFADVIKESGQPALAYIRSPADGRGDAPDF